MWRSTRVLLVPALVVPLVLTTLAVSAADQRAVPQCMGQNATIIGDSGDNVLTDTPQDDVIWAGGGNDRIDVRNGGNDLVCGNRGNDKIIARGYGNLHGGLGNDRFILRGGSFLVFGGDGNDRFFLVASDHALHGGAGRDWVDMSRARLLTLEGARIDLSHWESNVGWSMGSADTDGVENARGSDYNDEITGTGRLNVIEGLAGDDLLKGLNGKDRLFGGSGNDEIRGGRGDDFLDGGPGANDRLRDMSGTNTCINGNIALSSCS